MSSECFLAFDTSCYTTSVAVVSDGKVICDKRIMLDVQQGGRGLRQSEAVFQHIKNLKSIFLDWPANSFDMGSPKSRETFRGINIVGVGYSEKPRLQDDSYMPVFCVGESAALSCAGALGVRSYALTHQHGHIYSAFIDNTLSDGVYCVFHVSGGTLDILNVSIKTNTITDIAQIGGTLDITCGQLIDRTGVAAGLGFPAGEEMEKSYAAGGAKLSVNVSGMNANLSGAEAQAKRLIEEGDEASYVFSGVIDCVAETLIRMVKNVVNETNIQKFVFTGGVICNRIIREKILDACTRGGYECTMAQKAYSGDNACGLALAAQILYGVLKKS
jgi:N6-L-threonylcarbamoyladenine synthase